MAHRDPVGSDAGCPHLRHGAFYSSVASLRPVDSTGHEEDVMRAEECGVKTGQSMGYDAMNNMQSLGN